MVPGAGIEPALLAEEDFKSSVSAIPPSGQHAFDKYNSDLRFFQLFLLYFE